MALESCRLALAIFFANKWNANNLGMPYFIRYLAIIFEVQYFNNKSVITLVRTEKGQ